MKKFYVTFQWKNALLRHKYVLIHADNIKEARHMLFQHDLCRDHYDVLTESEWNQGNYLDHCTDGLYKEISALSQSTPSLE